MSPRCRQHVAEINMVGMPAKSCINIAEVESLRNSSRWESRVVGEVESLAKSSPWRRAESLAKGRVFREVESLAKLSRPRSRVAGEVQGAIPLICL